ncbi:MAG: hypothetical protein HW407_1935, partial [Bacteroidetes bacterium]|nr:hypothetical protein [Bacteroidota bacterium]
FCALFNSPLLTFVPVLGYKPRANGTNNQSDN